MKPIEEMTFDDLRVHYGTGRAVLLYRAALIVSGRKF